MPVPTPLLAFNVSSTGTTIFRGLIGVHPTTAAPPERPQPVKEDHAAPAAAPATEYGIAEIPRDEPTAAAENSPVEEAMEAQHLSLESTHGADDTVNNPDDHVAQETSANNHHDLIIESLPNWRLTEPIPVNMESLGETIFTGTISDLHLSATGTSIGNTLLLLKEQIEALYIELDAKEKRTADENAQLSLLRYHIAAPLAKLRSKWF